jgi:serine/threonine-protein kinase
LSDTVSRLNAALAGRYVIERELGEGGMATVFLARDVRHNRQVAIKVLKPELAAVVGAERFLAEIETTANLQHPHILPLFDSGQADGFLFYVMPFIDGETLADRISRDRQLPVDEAVGMAVSVCNALQVAHDAGIVHRDIKPGNILLSRGEPLVADFGIALAVGSGGGRLTETGLSVGTPYYMSPEQATGDQSIGPTADIYALACVLYEMLVGEPPYLGNTAQAVLGKIIQGVPVSATEARRTVPSHVDAAIRKALERLPADRFTRASDFAAALSNPSFRHGEAAGSVSGGAAGPWKVATAATAVAALAAVSAGVAGLWGPPPADPQVFRQPIEMPDLGPDISWGLMMALAPDGSGMVYMDEDGAGERALHYKARDEAVGTAIPNTGDINGVVFSPDGQRIAFSQGGNLITRPVRGGAATTLATGVDRGTPGLDWMADGTILFEIDDNDRLGRIPADGSSAADTVVTLGSMRWAHGIEGYESALLLRCPGCDLGIADLSSGALEWVLEDVARAWYVPTGHIVYVRSDGAVFAAPYDPTTRALSAVRTPLFEGVRTGVGWADMVVADDGTMIYVTGPGLGGTREQMVWIDRNGNVEPVDPEWPPEDLDPGVISPDGRSIVYGVEDEEANDVWVYGLPGGPRTRLTPPGTGRSYDPVWTPDGSAIVYGGGTATSGSILRIRADGSSPAPDTLFRSASLRPLNLRLTPDGSSVVFNEGSDTYRYDFGSEAPDTLWATSFGEFAPTVSPDGRWLAYTSDITGSLQVFVRPFPDVEGGRTQVSNGGGAEPVWGKSVAELYYRGGEGLMSAAYRADSTFVVESRTALFDFGENYIVRYTGRSYDVTADDQRFLAVRRTPSERSEATEQRSTVLVQNWFTELRDRLGEGND